MVSLDESCYFGCIKFWMDELEIINILIMINQFVRDGCYVMELRLVDGKKSG